jgi:hypothetical protein
MVRLTTIGYTFRMIDSKLNRGYPISLLMLCLGYRAVRVANQEACP